MTVTGDERVTSNLHEKPEPRRTEWWRGMGITEFMGEIATMSHKEQEALAAELASVSAIVSATVTDTTKSPDERRRAQHFLATISEKRKLLSSKLTTARHGLRESRKNAAEDLLDFAEARVETEPASAMRSIIKTMRLMWDLDERDDNANEVTDD
jgi:hypothetical protein